MSWVIGLAVLVILTIVIVAIVATLRISQSVARTVSPKLPAIEKDHQDLLDSVNKKLDQEKREVANAKGADLLKRFVGRMFRR